MMNTRKLSRLGLYLIVVLVSGLAWAQSVSHGTITGTVTLPSGERMNGVAVKLASSALVTGERTTTSDEQGRFVFLSLPTGNYSVTATMQGFKPFTARDIVLQSGDKRDVAMKLEVGAFEEAITVSGAAPIVDTRASTTETTFSEQLLAKLPTARDAFYDIAVTAPGVSSVGSDETWLRSPSALGSAANENIFLVNGVNATNPRGAPWGSLISVNYNTVEEVKILTIGSKAEYGSFSGAAIDVLTKSGSNEFKGDVAYYSMVGRASDNSTLNFGGPMREGKPLFYAEPNDVLTTIPKDSWEASVTFGGPVMKDRLWFYSGYSTNWSETDTPLFEPLSEWEADIFDLKLTGDLGPQHRAWLSYHNEDLRAGNVSWGQTWDATMVYDQPRDNDTLQLQYQWVMSDRDLSSFKYLGFKTEEHPSIPSEVGHPGFINWWKWVGGQSIGVGGDFPYVEGQKSERQTLQADYTHYTARFMGEHEMKFGVQYTRSEGNWMGGYFQGYANFAYPYPWDYGPAKDWWWNCGEDWCWGTDEDPVFPMYNLKITRNPWLTVRQAGSTGAFIDDTWSINDRLTLDVGFRYDRMTAKYGEGAVYELPTRPEDINNPTFLRSREGTGNIFDFETWSPRIGAAWTLTEDRKTVLRAHLGRYYAPLGVETLRRLGPDMEPSLLEHFRYFLPMSLVDLNGNGKIDFNEVRPATRLLAGRAPDALVSRGITESSWALEVEPGTDSPYTDQFQISIQRQIGADIAIEAGYIYKQTRDLLALQPYDRLTGEFFEWESVPFTTWTGYQTNVWQIKLKDFNGDGTIDVDDAKFVLGQNRGWKAVNMDRFAGEKVERIYNGLQLVLNKRYSNRWQALASVNWNESDGIAPRPVDQNWYIDGPLVMDTPFGATMNHFQNNLDGPLPMTPEWMVKISGSYTIPRIETDLGLRYRYDSGRPFFPVQSIPTFATWMSDLQAGVYLSAGWHDFMVADDPNNAEWLPSTSIVDLGLSKQFDVGGYGLNVSFDVLNALNEDSPNRVGFHQGDFGRIYGIVNPRTFRAGVKFLF